MKIYENIVIGNFLYGLGLSMRARSDTPPPLNSSLFQQTGLDRRFADVLLSNASTCRLIEFKRTANKSQKEEEKLRRLSDGLAISNPAYKSISREIHWYVEIDDTPAELDVRVIPYLDFLEAGKYSNLSDFIEACAGQACGSALDDYQVRMYRNYLYYLDKLAGSDASASGSGSGVLVMAITADDQLKWMAVENIKHIFMTREEFTERLKLEERIEPPGERIAPGYGVKL
jgi:hypothetical protein